ncbi:TlpA disulfide reductase family protein [Candidatus Margulisiibacteriota bacterium]
MGRVPKTAPGDFLAADFTLEDLNGSAHTLSDYQGKIVFLNFWATWCPPCRTEMPSMQKMYQSWDKDKYVLLAVDIRENKDDVKAFADKNGYTFPILLDQTGSVARQYGVRGIPATFILDENGKVVKSVVGAREWTLRGLQRLFDESKS